MALVLVLLLVGCNTAPAPTKDVRSDARAVAIQDTAPASSPTDALQLPEPATCPVGPQPPHALPAFAAPFAQCIGHLPDDLPGALGADVLDAALSFRKDATAPPALWHDGDWAPLTEGIQGAGHLSTDLLIPWSGSTAKPVLVEVVRQVWFDCSYHLQMAEFTMAFVPSPKPGWLMPLKPMMTVVNRPVALSCGQWARLQVVFRMPGETHWHAAGCTVQFYVEKALD